MTVEKLLREMHAKSNELIAGNAVIEFDDSGNWNPKLKGDKDIYAVHFKVRLGGRLDEKHLAALTEIVKQTQEKLGKKAGAPVVFAGLDRKDTAGNTPHLSSFLGDDTGIQFHASQTDTEEHQRNFPDAERLREVLQKLEREGILVRAKQEVNRSSVPKGTVMKVNPESERFREHGSKN